MLSRSNADMNAIKAQYQQEYRRTLESDVKNDLSMKTERMYEMVMAARRNEESAPVIPQQIDQDVKEITEATINEKGVEHDGQVANGKRPVEIDDRISTH